MEHSLIHEKNVKKELRGLSAKLLASSTQSFLHTLVLISLLLSMRPTFSSRQWEEGGRPSLKLIKGHDRGPLQNRLPTEEMYSC